MYLYKGLLKGYKKYFALVEDCSDCRETNGKLILYKKLGSNAKPSLAIDLFPYVRDV